MSRRCVQMGVSTFRGHVDDSTLDLERFQNSKLSTVSQVSFRDDAAPTTIRRKTHSVGTRPAVRPLLAVSGVMQWSLPVSHLSPLCLSPLRPATAQVRLRYSACVTRDVITTLRPPQSCASHIASQHPQPFWKCQPHC